MLRFAKWWNNSRVVQFLLTPWRYKRFWRTCQRLRICERCFKDSTDIHWAKDDKRTVDLDEDGHLKFVNGKIVYKMKYGHTYLCDECFYGDIFAKKD